jgi:hypothetical protein
VPAATTCMLCWLTTHQPTHPPAANSLCCAAGEVPLLLGLGLPARTARQQNTTNNSRMHARTHARTHAASSLQYGRAATGTVFLSCPVSWCCAVACCRCVPLPHHHPPAAAASAAASAASSCARLTASIHSLSWRRACRDGGDMPGPGVHGQYTNDGRYKRTQGPGKTMCVCVCVCVCMMDGCIMHGMP